MVTEASATQVGLPAETYNRIPVDEDHSNLVKFWGRDDSTYRSVMSRIKESIDNAQDCRT